ncbi:MAG: S-methyl-5-thioribose-1-phosphate isomerase [Salinivirgaceae bacterium]|nr:S-methyl-5-thioribose-1-phosphate isomerase [Salinivirgaceae bacterium]MDD4747559.1 S-methyl-5-thioribose-1-phosphate isomerase [Salinivirgaceae bacterium]
MLVKGKHYLTVWMEGRTVYMIEQNLLPFQFRIFESPNYQTSCMTIRDMITRGAGAIGATAGFAMAQAALEAPKETYQAFIDHARKEIEATRPTAYNLFFVVEKVYEAACKSPEKAFEEAQRLAQENVDDGKKIGEFGNTLIKDGYRIETHCNAGWLGFVDYGSALSPIYLANRSGKKIHVWVDETRPRSQGARLTAWEMVNENVPFDIIPDNAGAHYMSKGMVDMMIVGADRIAANGDTANKIGTLEKAIAAKYYNVPFYIAAPCSTIDMNTKTGKDIPIEERSHDEVLYSNGPDKQGDFHTIMTCAPGSSAKNPAFDVTPAELITGIITNKGIIKPTIEEIKSLF